jgi:hypothetical protein
VALVREGEKLSLEVARRESLPLDPACFLCPIASTDVPVGVFGTLVELKVKCCGGSAFVWHGTSIYS